MAMTKQKDREKVLWTPCPPSPAGSMHKAVFVDFYYDYDRKVKYKDNENYRDFIHMVLEMDTEIGMAVVEGVERPYWVNQRETINPVRLATQEFLEKIHREWKDKAGKIHDKPYELNGEVFAVDYARGAADYQITIDPTVDENGEPNFFIGPQHNLYKRLKEFGEENFEEAYNSGGISPESLVGKNCQVKIEHGKPDTNGQVWPRITALAPPRPDQDIKPSSHYVRVKDREQEEVPFL